MKMNKTIIIGLIVTLVAGGAAVITMFLKKEISSTINNFYHEDTEKTGSISLERMKNGL